MGIKRFFATADNTITNAYKPDLVTRATGSNMGASDVLEVFSIYAQVSSSSGLSSEESRVLINFDITGSTSGSVKSTRTSGDIPASGSVTFYLKLYNAAHGQTLPIDYSIEAAAVTKSWDEGYGLDMDEYKDPATGSGGAGSCWTKAGGAGDWKTEGGDITTTPAYQYSQSVGLYGAVDLKLDVTSVVEAWINGESLLKGTNGFCVRVYPSSSALERSFYTKKFFGRESEFFFKRPVLEARWDSAIKDDTGAFYLSSSLAPAADNLNTLYMYNYIKGKKTNIPDVGAGPNWIMLSIYSGSVDNSKPTGSKLQLPIAQPNGGVKAAHHTAITGGYVSAGVYSASFAFNSSSVTTIFPLWWTASSDQSTVTEYHTASAVEVKTFISQDSDSYPIYVTKVTNLLAAYESNEKPRFRIHTRLKNWSPTIYNVASKASENIIIEDAYYKIIRIADDLEVISYGTGSGDESYTHMSYDKSGNYFDLDMSMLDQDFTYGIKVAYKFDEKFSEQKELFKFRIERTMD